MIMTQKPGKSRVRRLAQTTSYGALFCIEALARATMAPGWLICRTIAPLQRRVSDDGHGGILAPESPTEMLAAQLWTRHGPSHRSYWESRNNGDRDLVSAVHRIRAVAEDAQRAARAVFASEDIAR